MNIFFKVWFIAAILTIVLTTICSGNVTPSEQCPGESFEGLRDRTHVIPCRKTRCDLPRNTNVTVTLRFTAENEVKSLTNKVYATIGGLQLPFIDVDGTDACQHVKRADTDEYVSCPLPAGRDYIYTNVFPVLAVYPTLNTRVHWSLNEGKKSLICFEVPVAITSGAKKN